jgi:hypothetical protein
MQHPSKPEGSSAFSVVNGKARKTVVGCITVGELRSEWVACPILKYD